jgi:hypothetical protein
MINRSSQQLYVLSNVFDMDSLDNILNIKDSVIINYILIIKDVIIINYNIRKKHMSAASKKRT